jgi:hypothetical protein
MVIQTKKKDIEKLKIYRCTKNNGTHSENRFKLNFLKSQVEYDFCHVFFSLILLF